MSRTTLKFTIITWIVFGLLFFCVACQKKIDPNARPVTPPPQGQVQYPPHTGGQPVKPHDDTISRPSHLPSGSHDYPGVPLETGDGHIPGTSIPDRPQPVTDAPETERKPIFACLLGFADVKTARQGAESPHAKLMTNVVFDEIEKVLKQKTDYLINQPGHQIHPTQKIISDLFNIVLDARKTLQEKRSEIIISYMKPYKMDVLVFGQFDENDNSIILRTAIFDIRKNDIPVKSFTFSKKEYFCPHPAKRNYIIVCRHRMPEIRTKIRQLLRLK